MAANTTIVEWVCMLLLAGHPWMVTRALAACSTNVVQLPMFCSFPMALGYMRSTCCFGCVAWACLAQYFYVILMSGSCVWVNYIRPTCRLGWRDHAQHSVTSDRSSAFIAKHCWQWVARL